ncbi:hypothetical protein JX266_006795 [Neoarthrinium moseri]|uniref:uncharacterized protein n=1 Tax=Neoarthrinium moseri TaxID=1658444 RepID=UPI001FDD681E|nr:uncharacterized protein JN550_012184 [Neoarthrinium moseri]KAI1847255.1 hypothetical protein JX266_006795 [Neoarthrinium moseri]KAI1859171.1 hypothetical protein JN550_012184 [Neoarthrinium moseri]
MRSTIFLVAAASVANANWLRWSEHRAPVWTPQETGYIAEEDQAIGFTPKPTPAPGVQSEGEHILNVLRRATSTEWINSQTCGWASGISSFAWTCGSSQTCATNNQNIVACVSGTYSPFFSVCFDHSAYERGQCASIGSQTGCCQDSSYPVCGTYIWTGSPVRSMFRCFNSATIISMLDEPQYVLDATRSTTGTRSSGDGAVTATSDIATNAPGSDNSNSGGSNSSSNTGAIVGGVVGGVAGIALIAGLIAFLILRNKKKNKDKQAYNAVPITEHNAPPGAGPRMSQVSNTATTYPPQSPFPALSAVHDPSGSYSQPYDPNAPQQLYDPAKQAYGGYDPKNLYPGVPSTMGGTSPPHSPGYPGYQYAQSTGGSVAPPSYQQAPMELEATSLPEGHQGNPVEMASSPHRP